MVRPSSEINCVGARTRPVDAVPPAILRSMAKRWRVVVVALAAHACASYGTSANPVPDGGGGVPPGGADAAGPDDASADSEAGAPTCMQSFTAGDTSGATVTVNGGTVTIAYPAGSTTRSATASASVPAGTRRTVVVFAVHVAEGAGSWSSSAYARLAYVVGGASLATSPIVEATLASDLEIHMHPNGFGGTDDVVYMPTLPFPYGTDATVTLDVTWGPGGAIVESDGLGKHDATFPAGAAPLGSTLGIVLGDQAGGTTPDVTLTFTSVCVTFSAQ